MSKCMQCDQKQQRKQKISIRKYDWKSLAWPAAYTTRFPLAELWEQVLGRCAFDKSVLQ